MISIKGLVSHQMKARSPSNQRNILPNIDCLGDVSTLDQNKINSR